MLLVSLFFGCSTRYSTLPTSRTSTLPVEPAEYTLGGWEQSKVCSKYILGFRFGHGFSKTYGVLANDTVIGFGRMDRDSADAFYNIIVENPEATHLVYPRATVQQNGLSPLFLDRCVTVRARTMRVGHGRLGKDMSLPDSKVISDDQGYNSTSIDMQKLNKVTQSVSKPTNSNVDAPTTHDELQFISYSKLSIKNKPPRPIKDANACRAYLKVGMDGFVYQSNLKFCSYKSVTESEMSEYFRAVQFEPVVQNGKPILFETTVTVNNF